MKKNIEFESLQDFWPFYVKEHLNKTNRLLHFIGTGMSLLWLVKTLLEKKPRYILLGILNGYGLAWIGHFFFEKNKPAALKYPIKSFISDWKMFGLIATGKMDSVVQEHCSDSDK